VSSLLPLRILLDPRSADEALRDPVRDSVNIPLTELADRTYELPSKRETVLVADTGPEGAAAVTWLTQHGREASLVEPISGTENSPGRLWSPNPFLEECVGRLSPGLALDLGCGAGREAIYLASLGWRVIAIDLLPDAIEIAKTFASRYPEISNRIEWVVADVSRSLPEAQNPDLVTMFYFLDRQAIAAAIERLRPGGSVILETFTELHRDRFGKPRSESRVLRTGEAEALVSGLNVQQFSEAWRPNGRHTARIRAQA
jgi:SAM-dependent methyltransferase